jgi:hypothetical protein
VTQTPARATRTNTTVRLNPDTLPRLDEIAQAEELPRAEVIRRLLRLGRQVYDKGPRPRWNR